MDKNPRFNKNEAIIDMLVAFIQADEGAFVTVIHLCNQVFLPLQWVNASVQAYSVILEGHSLWVRPEINGTIVPTPICIEEHKAYMLALPPDTLAGADFTQGDAVVLSFHSATGNIHVRRATPGEDDIRKDLRWAFETCICIIKHAHQRSESE